MSVARRLPADYLLSAGPAVDNLRRRSGSNRHYLPMESLPEVLKRLGGRATFSELTHVVPKRELAAAVEAGDIHRLSQGVYRLPGASTAEDVAVAYDGVVSHLSAALAWGLSLKASPEKPHITLPVKRRPRSGPPAVLHWASIETEDRKNRLTSLLRTVTDCARILPFDEALAVADSSLTRGLTQRELISATTAMRGPGVGRARQVAALATAASDSFLESMLRALLIQHGVEGFEPQVTVDRGWYQVRVDLGHRRAKIALEAEGYEFHGSSRAFSADCRRYDELVAAGWLVLRFTYYQVVSEPDWVVETVREALGQR
jgi:very-short-patch-repair endonuclease